ncbi:MAG TPA: hypothetical protein VIC26_10715 [Marinagarivorans sp.]
MNSVISAGYQGMVQSQHTMQRYAQDIASTNTERRQSAQGNGSAIPPSQDAVDVARGTGNEAIPVNEVPAAQPSQNVNTDRVAASENSVGPIEGLIAMRQQEQLFNASASVVEVGAEAVGSLIDDYS